jgi:hypothetical protein
MLITGNGSTSFDVKLDGSHDMNLLVSWRGGRMAARQGFRGVHKVFRNMPVPTAQPVANISKQYLPEC